MPVCSWIILNCLISGCLIVHLSSFKGFSQLIRIVFKIVLTYRTLSKLFIYAAFWSFCLLVPKFSQLGDYYVNNSWVTLGVIVGAICKEICIHRLLRTLWRWECHHGSSSVNEQLVSFSLSLFCSLAITWNKTKSIYFLVINVCRNAVSLGFVLHFAF